MDQSKIKAIKDRLYHLKAGRRKDTPVHDKTAIRDMNTDKMETPHLSNPFKAIKIPEVELPKLMTKSDNRSGLDKDFDMIIKTIEDKIQRDKEFSRNTLPCSENHEHTEECKKGVPFGKPFASEDQRKAMYAAANGNSTIGIPKEVGKEFVEASKDQDTSKLPKKVEKGTKLEGHNDLYKTLKKKLEVWRRG